MSRNRSRQHQQGTTYDRARESRNGQAYSPAGTLSRTPSADRKLLRTLTVTPEDTYPNNNYQTYDNSPAYHPPPQTPGAKVTFAGKQTPESRQSYNNDVTPTGKSPTPSNRTPDRTNDPTPTNEMSPTRTASYQGSVNQRTPSVSPRAASKSGRITIELPPPKHNSGKTDDWQAEKTVVESNGYMLKYEVASDVTFIVGESKEEIRSHKYMLMARSPVLFRSLVKHLGNQDVKIGVPDIKPNIFREMLQYIYTDEFDIHNDNVIQMLFAAKKFELSGLSSMCFQYLAAEMREDTVAKVMEQAHLYNETTLYEKCLRFVYANGNDVMRHESIGQLCAECMEKILKSDDLRSSEEAVFEGSVLWANAECRRKKLQPTDDARRRVLGKMLYLIRFPLMGVTYFTQKVSLGDLLTHDEKLSIFQYYHGEEQQLPQRFSRSERKRIPKEFISNNNYTITEEPQQFTLNDINIKDPIPSSSKAKRVHRFHGCDGQWKQNGPPDAISFITSQPIVLYGVEIFGCYKGTENYNVLLLVYDDISRQEIRKNEECIYTSPKKDTYDVFLAKPLRVPAKRVFTVYVALKGGATRKGVDGEAVHVVDGVTFEFSASNRSSNGTDVTVGQIAGLLFNKTQ